MPDWLIDWVVRFSFFCALNYSTIAVVTAFVCGVVAFVLLLVRRQVLSDEDWLLYLGLAFATFTAQYGTRAIAALIRRGDWSMEWVAKLEQFGQSLFSNLNSLFFLLAALALLYRLPRRWWWTKWHVLIWVFFFSTVWGMVLEEPRARYIDAPLSALCLACLSWAMYASSGKRQPWAFLNLLGGGLYVALHLVYLYAPTFKNWPRIASRINKEFSNYLAVSRPSDLEVLDSGIFAFAFALKLSLFIGALLIVMRCMKAFSPAVTREVLRQMKIGRAQFLGGDGIVRAMGESIGADAAALYVRVPSARRDELLSFKWVCGAECSDQPEVRVRPTALESILGQTLTSSQELWSRNLPEDERFQNSEPGELGCETRSFLNVPLQFHGAVIGSLNFAWRKRSAFTATDVQRARQIVELVTPVLQMERWLMAVSALRDRLQHYNFDPAEREAGTFIGRIVRELHDVLTPLGTMLVIEFGFRSEWALCGRNREYRVSFDPAETRTHVQAEEEFRRAWWLEAEFVEVPLKLEGRVIGQILFAIHTGSDSETSPSLTQNKQQLEEIATLVKDTAFDLHRKRYSSIIHGLNRRLNSEEVATEAAWMKAVGQAITEAGLREVGLSSWRSRVNRDRQPETTISREAVLSTETFGGYEVSTYAAGDDVHSLIALPLRSESEALFLDVERAEFGLELESELPWKLFLDRLSEAADLALVRIRSIELEREAVQFEISDLLVHELRSPADEFRLGVEVMEKGLDIPAGLRDMLRHLKDSANTFMKLADVILQPFVRDTRLHVPLREVVDSVEQFYKPRLPGKIELRRDDSENSVSIKMPFHLAYVVLVSLVRNAREAIGSKNGYIGVRAESHTDAVLLHVDDTGRGIPHADRDNVFVPGWTTKPDGSGRGLSLARRVLHRHKGDLVLASEVPQGVSTRFTVHFPRS